MSRRKRGDDDNQRLMPFVERIAPSGQITSSPKLTPPPPAPTASVPICPKSAEPPPQTVQPQPLWEGSLEWGCFKVHVRSNDARPWYQKLAQDGLRHLILRLILQATIAVGALLTHSTSVNVPEIGAGWTTTIERTD
jgi:hypothetical protein